MGLNPSIADAYFDHIEGAAAGPLEQNAEFLPALTQMGLFNEFGGFGPSDKTDLASDSLALAIEAIPDSVPDGLWAKRL